MDVEDVGADSLGAAMEDRADLQVDGLEAAEGPLHRTEAFVGAHATVGIEFGLRQAGAHHVQSIERRLGSNRRGVVPVGEALLLVDGPLEVLGHLVPGDDTAHPRPDLALASHACADTWRNIRDDLKGDTTCAIDRVEWDAMAGDGASSECF